MKVTTADRLKELMEKRNLKQVDILKLAEPYCDKYGVKLNRNDVSQYVSGKVEPKQKKLTVLANALNVSEPWLMGYDIEINTIAAHHDDIDWTDEELDEIEEFKKYILSKRVKK